MDLPRQPLVYKNLVPAAMLEKLQHYVSCLKNGLMYVDGERFHRFEKHDDEFIKMIHERFLLELATEIFGEKIKPSYSFISAYFDGQGICPVHVDRPPCYLTIDLCVNQKKVWPIYINSESDFSTLPPEWIASQEDTQRAKAGSREYLMEPGDAVCYSGTHHAHWRKQIDPDNFCDLIFFHFVREDYVGDLK